MMINNEESILAVFFDALAQLTISGRVPHGQYYDTSLIDNLIITVPDHVCQHICFSSDRKILFLRLHPVYALLCKQGYLQGYTLKELESAICANPSFVGHIATHRFRYRDADIPLTKKTICTSCIALDYDKYLGRVIHKNQLHPAQAWEAARPGHIIYDHFFYKESTREVRKVTGRIKIVKRIPINGRLVKKDCYRKARWDGSGHCYLGTHNIRSRQSDIMFPSIGDL